MGFKFQLSTIVPFDEYDFWQKIKAAITWFEIGRSSIRIFKKKIKSTITWVGIVKSSKNT